MSNFNEATPTAPEIVKESMTKFPINAQLTQDCFDLVNNRILHGNFKEAHEIAEEIYLITRHIDGVNILSRNQTMYIDSGIKFLEDINNPDTSLIAKRAMYFIGADPNLRQEICIQAKKNLVNEKDSRINEIIDIVGNQDNTKYQTNRIEFITNLREGLEKFPGDPEMINDANSYITRALEMGDYSTAKAVADIVEQYYRHSPNAETTKNLQILAKDMIDFRYKAPCGDWETIANTIKTDINNAPESIKKQCHSTISLYTKLTEIGK